MFFLGSKFSKGVWTRTCRKICKDIHTRWKIQVHAGEIMNPNLISTLLKYDKKPRFKNLWCKYHIKYFLTLIWKLLREISYPQTIPTIQVNNNTWYKFCSGEIKINTQNQLICTLTRSKTTLSKDNIIFMDFLFNKYWCLSHQGPSISATLNHEIIILKQHGKMILYSNILNYERV